MISVTRVRTPSAAQEICEFFRVQNVVSRADSLSVCPTPMMTDRWTCVEKNNDNDNDDNKTGEGENRKKERRKRTKVQEHLFILYTLFIPFGKFGPPYLGKATAAARATRLPSPTSACWVFSRFRNPPNSGMDYRIFNGYT